VDVHVAWLREKLAGSDLKIETVWGVGYKLVEIAEPEQQMGADG
jgi:DNA-binding response OmpR family regulator